MTPDSTNSDDVYDKQGLVERGSFNHVKGILGRPGTGKSYHALECAREFERKGCFVLAHDIGWRLAYTQGNSPDVVKHPTVQSAVQRLASDPRGIHCISCPSAEEVIQLAKLLAEKDMERNGGTKGHPVVIVIDEVVAAAVCDAHRLSDSAKLLIATRRHQNVGLIWTCQSARMVHNQLIGLSTEMVVFNLTMQADLEKLEACGIPPETIAKVAALPKYQHVEHRF